jgi:hypothetical protein
VRTRPIFSDRTNPLASKTCRCCTTAANDMGSGRASSLTDAWRNDADRTGTELAFTVGNIGRDDACQPLTCVVGKHE